MTAGACRLVENFFSDNEVNEIKQYALKISNSRGSVHKSGKYKDLQWYDVSLPQDQGFVKKILDFLGVESPELLVFYYLDPGAIIHPHRDLTGAGMNSRIRFHVPILTNKEVNFCVSNKRIVMNPGDLWCLDTSYLHSVSNLGDSTRVHIVIECYVTEKIKSLLPNDFNGVAHNFFYIVVLASSFLKAIFVNSINDPSYLKAQLRMVFRYFKWRVLKIGVPK